MPDSPNPARMPLAPRFRGRLTADPDLARKLDMGVGDDVVVELWHVGVLVGVMRAEAYALLAASLGWPSLAQLEQEAGKESSDGHPQ